MYLIERTYLVTMICAPLSIFLTWYLDSGWCLIAGMFLMSMPGIVFSLTRKECTYCKSKNTTRSGVGGSHFKQFFCCTCKEYFFVRIRNDSQETLKDLIKEAIKKHAKKRLKKKEELNKTKE